MKLFHQFEGIHPFTPFNSIKFSRDELRNCKVAKEGYETLWGFLKLLSSKVVQAYCEEIAKRKYRIELCMNGWANLYIGPKESKGILLKIF